MHHRKIGQAPRQPLCDCRGCRVTATPCTAVVLAGDRGPSDPVAQATGAPCKALSPVAGVPMLWRVLDTLRRVPEIADIVVVGPRETTLARHARIREQLDAAGIVWVAPGDSPAASAAAALERLAPDRPVLLTTADHVLLRPAMVEAMLEGADAGDLAVGLARYPAVRAAYPEVSRTVWRLAPDGYCSCNLFVARSDAGRRLIGFWRRVEAQRKHPARILVELFGWMALARYLLGRLALTQALARLSARVGVEMHGVLLDDVESAIDVDTLADLRLAEAILARRGEDPD